MKKNICKACGKETVEVFYVLDNVPVQSVLNIAIREKAVSFPRGKIELGFCSVCGFISNTAFKAEFLEYDRGYESTQSYSPTFRTFARSQADKLIEHYDLHDKDLVEIGCGNGEFLTLLCDLGGNRGVGFDPAYVEGRVRSEKGSQVTFVKDYYSEGYSGYNADFLYCKMTLEHINEPGDFVRMIRRTIGDRGDTAVFFQVPEATRILKDCAFEDIYYEHCSYFSSGSLVRLFQSSGFDVIDVETDYDGQYLMIYAKPLNGPTLVILPGEYDLKRLRGLVDGFANKLKHKLSKWRKRLDKIHAEDGRVVIWGSGSKGVAFLTALGVGDEIGYAVDINPNRQGTFMAGSGHEIIAPESLKQYRPDVVIAMNPVYKEEIRKDLQEMGLTPTIWSL